MLFVCCTVVNYAQNTGGGAGGAGGTATTGTSSGGVSDGQVIRSAASQKRAGASEAQIANQLLQQGATPQQLQRLRNQNANQIRKAGMDNAVDNGLRQAVDRSRTNNVADDNSTMQLAGGDDALGEDVVDGDDDGQRASRRTRRSSREVFGRNIFNNTNLTFAPNMNIATPQNYVLGPGDV